MVCKLYFNKAVKRKSSSSNWLLLSLCDVFISAFHLSPVSLPPFLAADWKRCWLSEIYSQLCHSLAISPGQVIPSLNSVFSSMRRRPECLLCLSLGLLWDSIKMVLWKVPILNEGLGRAKINNSQNKADALIFKNKNKKLNSELRKSSCLCSCDGGSHTRLNFQILKYSVLHTTCTSWRHFYDKSDFDKWL